MSFTAPSASDSRGPCPMLNVLANHGHINRDGRGITKENLIDALTKALNIGEDFATVLATGAIEKIAKEGADGVKRLDLADLAQHNIVEHDVSFSRQDFQGGKGNNKDVDPVLLDRLINASSDGAFLTIQDLAKHRVARYNESKENNPEFLFTEKDATTSHGETALILNIMGNQFDHVAKNPKGDDVNFHKVPVSYIKSFFGQEKFPDEWKPPAEPLHTPVVMGAIQNIAAVTNLH